jgi:hypothetical protein
MRHLYCHTGKRIQRHIFKRKIVHIYQIITTPLLSRWQAFFLTYKKSIIIFTEKLVQNYDTLYNIQAHPKLNTSYLLVP